MKIRATEISVVMGDITELGADIVVSPLSGMVPDEQGIRMAARAALQDAQARSARLIAFPALGCEGPGGFSPLASAKLLAQEVYRHIRAGDSSLTGIIFCCTDQEIFAEFEKGIMRYLEHIVNSLQWGPFVTVDGIIERDGGVVLIQRSNPPFGWALPGGFVDYGESLEDAVKREVREETGLEATQIRQFHTYSDPGRDPRFHTVGTAFIVAARGELKAGDDAAAARVVSWEELAALDLAFDHKKILMDYRARSAAGGDFGGR